MTSRLAICAAVCVAVISSSIPAAADDCDRGRQLFERAVQALEEGRAAAGRDLLRESARLCPRFATYMNLAIALRRTGDTPDAVQLLEELLAGQRGDVDEARRRDIEAQLEMARGELALLRIRVTGPRHATVEVDGVVAADSGGAEPVEVPVGAGTHVVRAIAEGFSARRVRITLAAGENQEVALALSPESVTAPPSDDGFPTLWVIGGASLAVAVTVIAVVLVAAASDEGTDPGVIGAFETLSFP